MRVKQIIFSIIAVILILCSLSETPLQARKKNKKKDDADKKEAPVKSKYEKLLDKDAKTEIGQISIHLKKGKVYLEVPDSLLGRGMLLGSTIKSISDNSHGLVGSKNNLLYFTFTKADSTLYMRELRSEYISKDKNIEQALSKSNIGAILKKMKIEAYTADSASYVIDATKIFLSDDKKMKPFMNNSLFAGYIVDDSFKEQLSYISDVKAFEDNVSITSSMSYTYSLRHPVTNEELIKNKSMTAEMARSILILPRKIYRPRIADPRIGYFFTKRECLGNTESTTFPLYLVNRWRLEPSDIEAYKRGEKVPPVKPITFYVDNDFPEWWKPYIKDAVLQWNEVFEEIGFKDALAVLDFPENNKDFDPDNIKYSCIRYAPVGIQNAMGPSWVDPRSGEIINASVYVYHDVIKLLTSWRFVQTSQADRDVRTRHIPKEILGEGLMYVIKHEIGHTLGLMHNMSASSVIPVEALRDPFLSCKHGTTTSIMDYARFNYVAQPGDKEKGVKLTPPKFGSYDKWAIRWGYTPVYDAKSFEEEGAITSRWISDSLKKAPFYRYGKQQQILSNIFMDPSCQAEDLGDDVIKASDYGISNLKYILENYMRWIDDKDDEDYEFRTYIYKSILNQYLTYLSHLINNIGGLYKNEIIAGDSLPRYKNVPAAKQKAILRYVFDQYRDLDWIDSPAVLSKLPLVGKPSYSLRKAVHTLLFMTPYYADKSDGISSKELNLKQTMNIIYDFVWAPTLSGVPLKEYQKILQRAFIESYMDMANFKRPSSGVNHAFLDTSNYLYENFEADSYFLARGMLKYSSVSGFEWEPRALMNSGEISTATIYSVLKMAYNLIKSRKNYAGQDDKAHYELLMNTIEYSLK